MTAPELSPAEAAKVAEFEAAPTPPEVVREQLAQALLSAAPIYREDSYALADAALAFMLDAR